MRLSRTSRQELCSLCCFCNASSKSIRLTFSFFSHLRIVSYHFRYQAIPDRSSSMSEKRYRRKYSCLKIDQNDTAVAWSKYEPVSPIGRTETTHDMGHSSSLKQLDSVASQMSNSSATCLMDQFDNSTSLTASFLNSRSNFLRTFVSFSAYPPYDDGATTGVVVTPHNEGMSGIGRPRGLSMQDFFSRYGTEEQCREALFAKRWPNGFVCLKMCRQHLLHPSNSCARHVDTSRR